MASTVRQRPTSQPSANESNLSNITWASIAFLTLSFLIPITTVQWEAVRTPRLPLVLAGLAVLYSSFRIAILIGQGISRPFDAVFWVFTYVFIGLALLAQIAANRYPRPASYSEATITTTAISILVGLAAYDLGRFLGIIGHNQGSRREFPFTIDRLRTIAVATLGLLFAMFAISRFGLATFFTGRDAVDQALGGRPVRVNQQFLEQQDKSLGTLTMIGARLPVFIGLYMLAAWRIHEIKRMGANVANRMAFGTFMISLIVANLIVNNPLGSSRVSFGLIVIAFASLYFNLERVRIFRIGVVILLFTFVYLFTALDAFRSSGAWDFTRGGTTSEVFVSSLDYGMTQQGHSAVTYVARNGHTLGRQLLGATFAWVPRRIWPDKPIPTGALVSGRFSAVSSSLWTEAWLDFGHVGVFVVLAGYGWCSGRIDTTFIATHSPALKAIVPLLAGYQFILLRGSLIPAVGGLIPLVLISHACFRRYVPKSDQEVLPK